MSFPVCLGAVPDDVRVRALAAGRADEDAVSLVPGSFEVGYVAEDGSAQASQTYPANPSSEGGTLACFTWTGHPLSFPRLDCGVRA